MRRFIAAASLAVALPTASLIAQEVITRTAVIIPEHIREKSVRAKKVFADPEALQKSLGDKLKVKSDELQKKETQLKSPSLSEEGRAKLQRELQEGEIAYKRLQEDSQIEFQKVAQKSLAQFEQEIGPIVLDLAKEWKVQMLFQWNQQIMIPVEQAPLVAFSEEVAKRYDKKHGVGGAAPAKPGKK